MRGVRVQLRAIASSGIQDLLSSRILHQRRARRRVAAQEAGPRSRRARAELDIMCQIGYTPQPLDPVQAWSDTRRVRVDGASFSNTPHHAAGASRRAPAPGYEALPMGNRRLDHDRRSAGSLHRRLGGHLRALPARRFVPQGRAGGPLARVPRQPVAHRNAHLTSAGRTSAVAFSL